MYGVATGGLDGRLLLFLASYGYRLTMPLINKNNTTKWEGKKSSYVTIIIKATIH